MDLHDDPVQLYHDKGSAAWIMYQRETWGYRNIIMGLLSGM